jgi:hypothetical protein
VSPIAIDMKGIRATNTPGHSRKNLYVYCTYNTSLLQPGYPSRLGIFVYVVTVETS